MSTPFYRYFCNPDPILKLERRWQFWRAAMTRNCFVVLERVKFGDQLISYKGEAGDDFVSHEAVRQRHEAAPARGTILKPSKLPKQGGKLVRQHSCEATLAKRCQGASG